MLLENVRLVLFCDSIEDNMVVEIEYDVSLSDVVFSMLVLLVCLSARALRDEVLHAASVQVRYLRMRLRCAKRPPWTSAV